MRDNIRPPRNSDLPTLPYAENQLIMTGEAHKIDRFVAELEKRQIQLTLISDLPIDFLERNIRLYRYAEDIKELIAEIEQDAKRYGIILDPNYHISATPWTVGGSPWTVGGSPWTVGGSPWTVGGSPWTVGGSPWTVGGSPWLIANGHDGDWVRARTTDIFYNQWAFGPDGVQAEVGLNAPAPAGKGVRVGVFDASPFPVTFSRVTLNMSPDLTLHLQHPIPGGACTVGPHGNAADHGLFVAGLIHALAPAADIHLIRVLDDAVQGDLFTLLAALTAFISGVIADKKALCGAVINLSLGLKGSAGAPASGTALALHLVLEAATRQDILVVAAAGNDSAGETPPLGPQIPAAWSHVIGVGASNRAGERACFSNTGDVLAPGGDGHCPCCQPAIDKCYGKDCDYALISLATGAYTGYVYGVGSSFATPLVSGLAALLQAKWCWLSPYSIHKKISSNSTAAGVISVQATVQ